MQDIKIKNELEEKIYEEELSIEELLNIKKQMINMDFDEDTSQYVDDMIEDCFDVMELDELQNIRNNIIELGLNTIIVDKYIKRKSPLTNELINSMDADDLEYIIDEGDLSLEQMLLIKKMSENLILEDYCLENLDEWINDYISEIETVDEVKEYINLFEKYGVSNSCLKRKIKEIQLEDETEENEIEEANKYQRKSNHSIFGKILVSDIAKHLFNSSKENDNSISLEEINKGNYESYQFEEEELEEDDYYSDDLD